MKKKLLAVIGIITITAAMLAGCSSKNVDVDADASTEPVSQTVSVSDTTKPAENTTVAESTTAETTTKKEVAKTTTKAAVKTTAAQKTTAKQTTTSTTAATTKATTTTVKNVSAKDVQVQVNAYIKSKGITVDSSLNPSNSGWSGAISAMQKQLNDGMSLKSCKNYVDMEIASMGTNISLYCYHDSSDEFFYICYM